MTLQIRPDARVAVSLAALAVVLALPAPVRAAGPEAGSVRLARPAESDFDSHTLNPSTDERAFMRGRFWRMRTYSPYFDSRTSWYPDAWTYKDLYAIYRDSDLAQQHPEWILRDTAGHKLYIPFDCGGGTCSQYAGDIGDPGFRASWIAAAMRQAGPYRGVFVDDVNLEPRVSDGNGQDILPVDERTGRVMTEADWRRYMAEFTEQIRWGLGDKEIVHNALWFAGHGDAFVQRELDAATHVEIERGVNDPGLTGGGGQFGYETLLAHIDWLHARGKGVILDSYGDSRAEMEYELASYFLISNGQDGLGSSWQAAPGDWWPGYDVRLGAPLGDRYEWRGLLRRDFEGGFVLVNQPGREPVSVDLGPGALDPSGQSRPSIVLSGSTGAVVSGAAAPPGLGASRASGRGGRARTRTRVRPVPNPPVMRRHHGPLSRATASLLRRRAGGSRRLHRAVLVRGRVRHAPRGSRVRVRLERRAGTRWIRVRVGRPHIRQGRFDRLFRGLHAGRFRVVAVYAGSPAAERSGAARRFRLRSL